MNLKASGNAFTGEHVSQLESQMHRLASMGMPIREPMSVAIFLFTKQPKLVLFEYDIE